MGNFLNCIQLSHRRPMHLKDLSSDLSLSMDDKESIIQQIATVNSEKKELASFSWNRMQTQVLEHIVSPTSDVITSKPLLLAAKKVFDRLNSDLIYYGMRMQSTLGDLDATFPSFFSTCSSHCSLKPLTNDDDFKMYLHHISMLKLHQIIIDLLLIGELERAFEILEMIALSHVLLNIKEYHFRFHSMALIKFLQKFGDMNAQDTTKLIEYMNAFTKQVCEFVLKRNAHGNIIDEMTLANVDEKSTARENYRTMKKWAKLVEEIRKSVEKEITMLLECQPENYESYDVADEMVNNMLQECFQRTSKRDFEMETEAFAKRILELSGSI